MDIEKIAKLARVKLTEEEISMFEKDLEEIKKMFDEIDELEVTDEPCFQPVEVKNAMREDEITEGLYYEDAFSNAEHRDKGFFKGPKV